MSNNLVVNDVSGDRMNASFEERSAWIQLIGLSLVLIGYAWVAGKMWLNGVHALLPYGAVFTVGVVLLVVILIVGHIAVGIVIGPEGRDERDRIIGWRAESGSSWLLGCGVFACLIGMMLSFSPVLNAHILLASLFLSVQLKLVLQIVFYHRGP